MPNLQSRNRRLLISNLFYFLFQRFSNCYRLFRCDIASNPELRLVNRPSEEGAGGIAILATARDRRPGDDTLAHGARVMAALIEAASAAKPLVGAVVSKGGITSAEVARTCFAARTAHVRGQVAAGISVWDLGEGAQRAMQVIVPGNVGDADTLIDVMHALGIDRHGRR